MADKPAPTLHCSLNSTEEARSSRPPTPGEIAYDEVHEAITDLWDALAEQDRREYTD